MAESKLEQIRELLSGLLACREQDKPVIVSLCDRGTEHLEELCHKGPELVAFLDQWVKNIGKVSGGYLTPADVRHKSLADNDYEKLIEEDMNNFEDTSPKSPRECTTPLPADTTEEPVFPGDSSFSVLGLGSFPPQQAHALGAGGQNGMDQVDAAANVERYVTVPHTSNELLKELKRECFEKNREILELKQQVNQLRGGQLADHSAGGRSPSSNTELVKKLQELSLERCEREREMTRLRRENQELTQRLSQEMSCRVSSDETDLENVNIRNRPVNIAADYKALCSTAWLDAKNELDLYCHGVSELEKLRLLRKVLMTSEKKASEIYKRLEQKTELMFRQPLGHLENMERIDSGFMPQSMTVADGSSPLPPALSNAIGDYLRGQADKVDLSYLVEEVKKYLIRKTGKGLHDGGFYSNKAVQRYIQQCAQLVWKLQLQRPAMTLDDKTGLNEVWKKEGQELYFKSECKPGEQPIVKSYVHPALIHNTTVLAKGWVYVACNKREESVA